MATKQNKDKTQARGTGTTKGTGAAAKGTTKATKAAKAATKGVGAAAKARSPKVRAAAAALSEEIDSVQERYASLKRQAEQAGSYSESYEILMKSITMTQELQELCYREIQERGVVLIEESREGASRITLNPAARMFNEFTKELRISLSEHELTPKSSKMSKEDEMDKLLDVVGSI